MTSTYHFHYNPDPDPVALSWQQGWEIYHPLLGISVAEIQSYYTLDQLIAWINETISQHGPHTWYQHAQYSVPQIIKINRLYHDLKRRGNRKPLLLRTGLSKWDPLTGDTRLRAYELIDTRAIVSSILVVQQQPVMECNALKTQLDFAQTCQARPGTPFWLRVGEQGLEWYEMAADLDCGVTGQHFADDAQQIIIDYVARQGHAFRFDKDWFCCQHPWI